MLPETLKKFIELFSKIPGIGPRQAHRLGFWFLKRERSVIYSYALVLKELAEKIAICPKCFFVFERTPNSPPLCSLCRDPQRDKTVLLVVEKETDLISIEKTKKYSGQYFILGGLLSPLKKNGQEVRIKELLERIKKEPELKEVILGLSHTTEGDLTALELNQLLSPLKLKITRLGLGLPRGAEVEFADEDTLSNALSTRR